MPKFLVDDEVTYVGKEERGEILPGFRGRIKSILPTLLLTLPPKNVYEVEFYIDGNVVISLNDNQLELFSRPKMEEEKIESPSPYREGYQIISDNWNKIILNLEECIQSMLEDGNPEQAIKYAILLEQACHAKECEDYSFEGKLNVR